MGLIGPGIVLAGTSIGSGEWLFGPAVTAQYGAALLWLALLSILFQGFCNLTMMRYTVYSGEPIIVGGLRTWPGPGVWVACYAVLDITSIWPYNASNAAVPLAAVVLGRLPQTMADQALVKVFGFAIFLLAFVPLVFGGTVYRMLERIMTAKLVLVLGYLSLIAVTLVSWPVIREVCTGFVSFGTVPLRAQSIILERHFTLQERQGTTLYRVSGTWEKDGLPTGDFFVVEGDRNTRFNLRKNDNLPAETKAIRDRLLDRARALAVRHHFFVEADAAGARAVGRRRNRRLSFVESGASDRASIPAASTNTRHLPRSPSPTSPTSVTCSCTRVSKMWPCLATCVITDGCLRWIGRRLSRSSALPAPAG